MIILKYYLHILFEITKQEIHDLLKIVWNHVSVKLNNSTT